MSRPRTERPDSPLGRRRNHNLAVRMLAESRTLGEIGSACGVSQSAVSRFAKRHADEIQRLRDNALVQLSSLWIADQAARLATLQEMVERLIELAEADMPPAFDQTGKPLVDTDGRPVLDTSVRVSAIREIRASLRSAAEELGQLRPKLDLEGQTLRVEIVGVSLTDL